MQKIETLTKNLLSQIESSKEQLKKISEKDLRQQQKNQSMNQQVNPPEATMVSHNGQIITLGQWFMITMAQVYPLTWKHETLPDCWTWTLSSLGLDQIRLAVAKCIKDEEFPPSPAKFKRLATGFDATESFYRFINREKLTDAEYWASQHVGFKCRTQLSEKEAIKLWGKTVSCLMKKGEDQGLPPRGQAKIADKRGWLAPDGNYYTCPADYYAKGEKPSSIDYRAYFKSKRGI